jgi:drug/metabolite transporter (DMT)-like permease
MKGSRVWLAFAALGFLWGIPYYFIKIAVVHLSPAVIACGRLTTAALVLLPVAWYRGALRGIGSHAWAICAFAFVEFAMPFCAISSAEQWIPSSVAGILIATVPLVVLALSRFFSVHEPLPATRLVGLVVGLAGVAALVGVGPVHGARGWLGVLAMMAAAVGYATGPLIIQRYFRGFDALGPVAASILVADAMVLVPAFLQRPGSLPPAEAWMAIAILGVPCTAVAMLLMFYLVSVAGAARATVITYINPVVATLLGTIQLHENLGIGGYVGLALILGGSWLSTRHAAPAAAAAAPA